MLFATRRRQTCVARQGSEHTRSTNTTVSRERSAATRECAKCRLTSRWPRDTARPSGQGRTLTIRLDSEPTSWLYSPRRESVRSTQSGPHEAGNRPPEPHSGARFGSEDAKHRDWTLPWQSPSDFFVRPAELRAGTTSVVGPRVFTRQRGQARSIQQTQCMNLFSTTLCPAAACRRIR
jgi:hypothetical protein